MGIWLIAFMVISLLTLFITNKLARVTTTRQKTKSGKKKMQPMSKWMLFITGFAVIMLALIIASATQCKKNSEIILNCVVDDNQTINIFYDDVENKYFVCETNWWNPIKMFERDIIDEETAKKAIDATNTLKEVAEEINN